MAQVLLYLLLMEERYGQAVHTGLLWNSYSGPTMQAVSYSQLELASLIMHRNRLAAHLVAPTAAPPPPMEGSEAERACRYCSAAPACALYMRASAGASSASAAGGGSGAGGPAAAGLGLGCSDAGLDISPDLRRAAEGIRPSCAAFFAHWARLVDLEEASARAGHAQVRVGVGCFREGGEDHKHTHLASIIGYPSVPRMCGKGAGHRWPPDGAHGVPAPRLAHGRSVSQAAQPWALG